MLAVSQLRFERRFEAVFQSVDFALPERGLLWVTGANGSGKTTLLRLLAGILVPSGGSIRCTARGISFLGHQLAIKDDLSVEENLRFMCDFAGGEASRIAGVTDRLGLRKMRGQLARTLSAGQRKRCALGRLLMNPGQLWLLDEPHANLDREGIEMVDELVRAHLSSGGGCVLTTHGLHQPAFPGVAEARLHLEGQTA